MLVFCYCSTSDIFYSTYNANTLCFTWKVSGSEFSLTTPVRATDIRLTTSTGLDLMFNFLAKWRRRRKDKYSGERARNRGVVLLPKLHQRDYHLLELLEKLSTPLSLSIRWALSWNVLNLTRRVTVITLFRSANKGELTAAHRNRANIKK